MVEWWLITQCFLALKSLSPRLFLCPPPLFLAFFTFPQSVWSDTQSHARAATEINGEHYLKSYLFFSFSFPLSLSLSISLAPSLSHFHFRSALKLIPMLVLLLIFILCKCSINVRGMNMKIRCQASLHEIAFGKTNEFFAAANCPGN